MRRTGSWKNYLYHGCRLALGATFLYAGVVKADDVTAFARDVANYKILPYSLNYLVAAALPYVEVVAGLMLVFNRRVRPATLVLGGLTLAFMLALVSVIARGMEIDCGCFKPGAGEPTSAWVALVRDAGLLLLAGITYGLRSHRRRR